MNFEELRKRQPTKLLPNRKQGSPLLLGEELDTTVKAYTENIQKAELSTAIVLLIQKRKISKHKRKNINKQIAKLILQNACFRVKLQNFTAVQNLLHTSIL